MSVEEGIDLKKPKTAPKPVDAKFKLETQHPDLKAFENSIISYEFRDKQLRLTFKLQTDTADKLYQSRYRLTNAFHIVHYDENEKQVLKINPNTTWSHIDMSSSAHNNLQMTIVLDLKN